MLHDWRKLSDIHAPATPSTRPLPGTPSTGRHEQHPAAPLAWMTTGCQRQGIDRELTSQTPARYNPANTRC